MEVRVEENFSAFEGEKKDQVSIAMLRDGADFVSSNPSQNARYSLFHLSQVGDVETLRLLLGLVSVEVNIRNSAGATPLHCAANYFVVRCLLANGASPDAVDSNGYSPLMLFLSYAVTNYYNGVPNEQNHSLLSAIDCFQLSNIENYSDEQKSYIFSLILKSPFIELLNTHPNSQFLLEHVGLKTRKAFRVPDDKDLLFADMDVESKTKKTMQLLSSRLEKEKKDFRTVLESELLRQSQALQIVRSRIRDKTLHAYYPESEQINWLLTGALWCLNPLLRDEYGQCSSHHLADSGDVETLEIIVENADKEELDEYLNAVDVEGNSPLHLAAYNGNFEVVNLLLEHDFDLYQLNTSGETALHLAIYGFLNGDLNCVTCIDALMAKCDVNVLDIQDLNGNSPLDLILRNEALRERFHAHDLIRAYEYELLQEEEKLQEIDFEIERIKIERERLEMQSQEDESVLYNQEARLADAELVKMFHEDALSKDYENSFKTVASSSTSVSEAPVAAAAMLSVKAIKAQKKKAEAQRQKEIAAQLKAKDDARKKHQQEIEAKIAAELKELKLEHMTRVAVEVSLMLEEEEGLDKIGKKLSEILKEVGIIEIRKFFDYFGENKAKLVSALVESKFHDPRLLLAVVNGFDFSVGERSAFLNRSIAVTCERFQAKDVDAYGEADKLHLLNSLAFIRVLSHKILADDDSRRMLGELFAHLKAPPAEVDAAKFLDEKDSNCSLIVKYIGSISKPSEYQSLLVVVLSSVARLPESSSGIEDAMSKTLFRFFVKPDIERDGNPTSPFALELFKARFDCVVADFKCNSYPLLTIAAETNTVLSQYLIDEGCAVNIEGASREMQPLWSAARCGNLEIIKLLKSRGADLSRCVGIEDMVNKEYRPKAAASIIAALNEKPAPMVGSAVVASAASSQAAGGAGGPPAKRR